MIEHAYCVPREDAWQYWTDEVRDQIARALRRQNISNIDRVEAAVLAGVARLWIVYGVETELRPTELNTYFRVDLGCGVTFCENGVCNVVAYCGDLKRFHLYPELKRYAESEGCKKVRLVGPLAWQRVLGPEWKAAAYVLEREV